MGEIDNAGPTQASTPAAINLLLEKLLISFKEPQFPLEDSMKTPLNNLPVTEQADTCRLALIRRLLGCDKYYFSGTDNY